MASNEDGIPASPPDPDMFLDLDMEDLPPSESKGSGPPSCGTTPPNWSPAKSVNGGPESLAISSDLPEIDAPPGMHPAAVRAARLAVKACQHSNPGLCGLCLCEPKQGKQCHCKKCRSKLESAETNAKAQDARLNNGTTPNMDLITELKQAPDKTRLRLLVFDFEEKTNPTGQFNTKCKARSSYDFCQYGEYWESSTNVEQAAIFKYLTKFKYFKHFSENEGQELLVPPATF